MAKKGEVYLCSVCGVQVKCVKGCKCKEASLACCTKAMQKKKASKE